MTDIRKEYGGSLHSFTKDTKELYLARRGLTTVPDMSILTQLRYIWLNNNRIRAVHGHVFNCCLVELYLQNNEITSVSGALKHLTCLRVLMLHNNQMKVLEETVDELINMQCLRTLNLFLNPFTQDPEYRKYVIHHLPSVELLDRRERHRILNTLAFGRRAPAPPVGRKITCGALRVEHNMDLFGIFSTYNGTGNSHEHRSMNRSIMQFTTVDWCGMTTVQRCPLEDWSSTAYSILNVKFR
ncbi:leucine-rich repeat-containing protein 72 [Brachyhypopomus gauderio]|uniref:leucine-rich repeat-containing protein 72 n=1 Tax=Brachyhypopomus gauderio TaxID=698409 RepID=UPI0040410343